MVWSHHLVRNPQEQDQFPSHNGAPTVLAGGVPEVNMCPPVRDTDGLTAG